MSALSPVFNVVLAGIQLRLMALVFSLPVPHGSAYVVKLLGG